MNDRWFLWLAVVSYAVSGVLTLYRLRRSQASSATNSLNYATMLAGFAAHTAFLYARGQIVQRCPLTNAFETTIFIMWAAVLFYLLIGPAYRVSFLGAFTAPVVLVIALIALLGLDDTPHGASANRSPWVDFHAAIAILACGAFALAFVTGLMYLIQERQLKSRKLTSSFLLLPSIEQLEVINFRLILLGFMMLTAGMVGGVVSYKIVGHWTVPKITWAVGAWLAYATIVTGRWWQDWRGKRLVQFSMVLFVLVLVTYWVVSRLGSFHGGPP
jgi:ABC-type uncharacterized transport system permease subunit